MTQFLKDVAIIKNGKEYKGIDSANGKYPIFGTGGIIAWTDKYLYEGESVLIGRKGTITNPQYINGKFWTIDTLFYTIIDNNKCLPKFLYYYLSLLNFKKFDEGTSIPSLTQSTLYTIPLKLPTLNKQQQIVDIIGSIDEYIENLSKQLKIMNNLTKLVFQFMFYNKKNVMNMKKFNFLENPFVLKIGNNVTNFIKCKKYIATANVEKQTIESIDSLINFNNRPSRANNQPKVNTIWFAKMKKTNKKILVNENDVDICENYIFSTGFQGLQIEKKYLYYYWEYINLDCFEEYKNKNANGATQQAIDETTLKLFTIKLPNFEKIDKFNRIVSPIFAKKSQIRKLIETSESYKSIILPLLINFQIF